MILLRLLNPQGIAGLATAICLALLLILQKGETRHWKKQSGQFEQLYHTNDAAFARTVADYRTAASAARAADHAAAEHVRAQQDVITERTAHDYQSRLAAARDRAQRLRQPAQAAANPGVGGTAPMPRLPTASGGAAQAAGQNRLPVEMTTGDSLIATEQAIQLDELIRWTVAQHGIDPNAPRQ